MLRHCYEIMPLQDAFTCNPLIARLKTVLRLGMYQPLNLGCSNSAIHAI